MHNINNFAIEIMRIITNDIDIGYYQLYNRYIHWGLHF